MKKLVWLIGTKDKRNKHFGFGGGILVHPNGLIISLYHVVLKSSKKTLMMRGYGDIGFRRAHLYRWWPEFDLALLWVKKNSPDEKFTYYNMGVEGFQLCEKGKCILFDIRTFITIHIP